MTAALPAQAMNKMRVGRERKNSENACPLVAFEGKTPLCKLQERGLHLTLTIQNPPLEERVKIRFIGEQ